MTPAVIAEELAVAQVRLAAVTDHNSCENVQAVTAALASRGIACLAGMEVETREEVHVLCFLPQLEAAWDWQEWVYRHLPYRPNDERRFGPQIRFTADGQPAGQVERLLALSIEASLDEVVAEVKARGGLCIPAHVDRPAYSLLAMLGVIPEGLDVPALEISPYAREQEVRQQLGGLGGYRIVSFSDAHHPSGIVPARTTFYIDSPVLEEIRLALRGEAGRQVVVLD